MHSSIHIDHKCIGVDPYNLAETGSIVSTVTTYVGQSTGTGPKVVVKDKNPKYVVVDMGGGKSSSNITYNLSPTISCTHGGEPVIGTIDAHIYLKNSNQDNSKYIITKQGREAKMDTKNPIAEKLKQAIGEGKDVIWVMNLAETLLKVVADGIMTIEEAVSAIKDVRGTIGGQATDATPIENGTKMIRDMNEEYKGMADENTMKSEPQDSNGENGEEMCIVRRLTPTETARLQGFPDDYTKIDGPDTADAPQFKSHGNSWATPCANHMSNRMEMEIRRLGHDGTIRYATCCSGIEAHSVAVSGLNWKSVFFSEIEPFPCRVLAAHYPQTPNLGDMTQIHYDAEKGCITNSHKEGETYSLPKEFKEAPILDLPFTVGELEVFSGGTPCFAKGANVLTKTGYKPIEDIKVGEEVATHTGRFCKVLRVGKKLSSELVEVRVVGRSRFICTADHPFPLLRSHRHKNGKYYFDKPILTPIRNGQSLYMQMVNAANEDFGVEIPLLPRVYNASNREIYELCGWYVGDGYIRGWTGKSKKAIVLCLNSKDVAVFNERFAGRINYTIAKSAGIFKVQICCTEFARFLHTHFGELAYGKKIPMWAYNKEVREDFIRGYLQTDGCFTRNGHSIQWSTVSQSLAYGIADIVGRTSVNLTDMPKTTTICGRTVNQRNFYVVRHNDAANHFHKVGKFDCVKVSEVKKLDGKTDWVYNLEVEEDHTYIVNGLVTHNCQSISVAGKREGMAEGSGTRSSLAFHYQRIIDELRPMFTLWENVPGAFSSNGGADFIWFVNRCAESGYAMAWRVIDAQYTMTEEFPRAVPQRRRRIWLVGYRGNDWRIPARIVFELEKDLTSNPPERVPGLGFKTLSDEGHRIIASGESSTIGEGDSGNDSLFGLMMESDDGQKGLFKVSKLIDFSEMPENPDFSQVSMADVYSFAKKVGEPGYIGEVFRTDKKKKAKKIDNTLDLFSALEGVSEGSKTDDIPQTEEEDAEWVGAEKITPAILENIGNAGILANGRICTLSCHEWTSGIQLSPETYAAWEELVKQKEWLKANDLLPMAYDETVCGLSDVLQEDPDEKYNLSWRACFGILRRAESRGKELPPALAIALVSTIRENAGIVKWIALNGKDTKKKETDLTERESAMLCFQKFIAPVAKFEDVEAEQPKRKNDGESDVDGDLDDEEVAMDEDGNPILQDNEGFGMHTKGVDSIVDNTDKTPVPTIEKETIIEKGIEVEKMPNLPNGVINTSGGETAATLIASGDAAVGTTQDANVIALKKEG